MKTADRYTWEAQMPDGRIVTAGADIAGALRFSLMPAPGVLLPRHDLIGVDMERRFCRAFQKIRFNQVKTLPGLFFWRDGSDRLATSEDLTGKLSPGGLIGKGVAGERWYPVQDVTPEEVILTFPYSGVSKPKGFQAKVFYPTQGAGTPYLHCVVCKGFRLWVNYETGAVLITERDREIYL